MKTSAEKTAGLEAFAEGLYWESRASESLGVPRKLLARMRAEHLEEGADWRRLENNAVALTDAGLEKIAALLRAGPEVGPEAGRPATGRETGGKPASLAVPGGPPPRAMMVVVRVPQISGLLLCEQQDRAVQVAVRVRENGNFVPGMELEAIQSESGVWQFRNRSAKNGGNESTVGRLPRGKGRW